MEELKEDKRQLSIELKPEVARGNYSNLAIISHSHSEFVIDFATILPGVPKPEVASRIVMAPEHAKRLLGALTDNIQKYEALFGPIKFAEGPKGTFNLADFAQNNGTKS